MNAWKAYLKVKDGNRRERRAMNRWTRSKAYAALQKKKSVYTANIAAGTFSYTVTDGWALANLTVSS